MSACDLRSTTVGWALHALEPDEERRVLDHLPHCAVCRRTLRETQEVTTVLAAAVPRVDPPARLRERVLAVAELPAPGGSPIRAVAAGDPPVPPLAPMPWSAAGPAGEAPPGTLPEDPFPADPLSPTAFPQPRTAAADDAPSTPAPPASGPPAPPGGDRSGRPTGPRRWALLAVAAVVLGVAVLSGRALLSTAAPAPSDIVAARADRIVGDAEARDPAGRHALLRAADGTLVAVVLDDGPSAAAAPRVVPLDLPAAGAGREYVLWRVAGSGAVPVGTFRAGGDDTRPVPGTTPGPVTAYAVSDEPAAAVPATPSNMVAGGVVV